MLMLPCLLAQMGYEAAPPAAPRDNGFHWIFLFNPAVVWVLIPIAAIVIGGIAKIIQRSQEHRERMAMIAAGLHPDYPPDEISDSDTDSGLRETTAHAPL